MSTVLNVKNLKKVYGAKSNRVTALNDVDLEVERGDFVSIMGPSGAGKTTLLNIIATIDHPTSGVVEIGGETLTKMSEDDLSRFRREHLGFIFQDFNLLDNLTVSENIILPLTLKKIKPTQIRRKLSEVACNLGINDILDKYPITLSGGQKQRTAAARAIINNPTLVLADEPTGALDSKAATDLLRCMGRLNTEKHSTILMVTHDPFAASYSKRVVFIKDGKFYTELNSDGDRKNLFRRIIDVLKSFGGEDNDVI